MFIVQKSDAERTKVVGGTTATVLFEATDMTDAPFAVTWNDVEPGGTKATHSHESVQAYVIVRGVGRMQVGDETRDLVEGDLAFVPSWAEHGIENTGTELMTYVAITNPAPAYTQGWSRDATRA